MVLLDHRIRLEHVDGEALGIILVESDQPECLKNIRIQHVHLLTVRRRHHVSRGVLRLRLLDASETVLVKNHNHLLLGHKEYRIRWPVFQQ